MATLSIREILALYSGKLKVEKNKSALAVSELAKLKQQHESEIGEIEARLQILNNQLETE